MFLKLVTARIKASVGRWSDLRLSIGIGFAVILSFSGCGWHLQGSARLPESVLSIYLDTQDPYSDFYRELRGDLLTAGAQVQTQAPAARAVVHIKADKTWQTVALVSTLNQPQQYAVYYHVEYTVSLSGAETIPLQIMELTTNYSYDSTIVLAKQREQLSMQHALARELAGQVLRRLATINAHTADHNVTDSQATPEK